MRTFLTFFAILVTGLTAPPAPKLPRVFLGDASHPVAYGEVWLIEHGSGSYPAVLVGTIRNGQVETDPDAVFPECSDWGDGCKLALGLADQAPAVAVVKEMDMAYGRESSGLAKRFATIYLSARIDSVEAHADWLQVLNTLGSAEGGGVVLPRLEKRTVRLLDPAGRPRVKARVTAALFGANNNHCGMAVGIPQGEFVSDAKGQFTVSAPRAPLAISLPYYEEQPEGPAGTAYALRADIVTGAEPEITIKQLWALPEKEYAVMVRQGNAPVSGVRLKGCAWNPLCETACGPVGGTAMTDSAGVARFRDQDLRRLRNLSLTDGKGRTMYLSLAELRELLSTGRVSVAWREPPAPAQAPIREP